MALLRVYGFQSCKTYVIPQSVVHKHLVDLSVEEFSVLCRAHGGLEKILYNVACTLCKNSDFVLDCMSDVERVLRSRFAEQEWIDLVR